VSSSSRVQGSRKNATCKRHNTTSLPHFALFLDPSKLEDEGTISRCLKSAVCLSSNEWNRRQYFEEERMWMKVSAIEGSVGSD